ncbi:MAG: adenylyl-sulfate kinase [Candidatus Margulisbacteria bacterium]|nr:adenylyl-sulfate kinase [Candidatus Margulisiibacteriota bacterium]
MSNNTTGSVLWFTGLSGSGKSTLADMTYKHFKTQGLRVEQLDGDTVRQIFPNTGFTKENRIEHIERIGYLCSVLEKHGIIVIASFISPYHSSREFVRNLCHHFIEIYMSTPLSECEKRDIKGLYKKARQNEIQNFTGISDPYEIPKGPEITLNTQNKTIAESFEELLNSIQQETLLPNMTSMTL